MKTYLLLILLFVFTLFCYGQKKSISLNYSYLTDTHSSGVGMNAKFNIWNKLYLSPDFTYYFKRDMTQFFNGNINIGYSIALPVSILRITPYTGLGIHHIYTKGYIYDPGGGSMGGMSNYPYPPGWRKRYDNRSELVANFGLNIEVNITRQFFIHAGTKYILGIGDSAGNSYLDQFVINTGIGLRF